MDISPKDFMLESETNEIKINFKFEIGEEVYSPLLKVTAVIEERLYRQTKSGNAYYEYAIWVKEGDSPKSYTIEENWLQPGPGPVQD